MTSHYAWPCAEHAQERHDFVRKDIHDPAAELVMLWDSLDDPLSVEARRVAVERIVFLSRIYEMNGESLCQH